jgi:hypothetical protein
MTDQPDLREQITALFRDGYLYVQSPRAIADAVLAVVEPVIGQLAWLHAEAERLRREVEFEANGIPFALEALAARYEAQAQKAEEKLGEHPDALMANACWTRAAKWLREAAPLPPALATPDEWSKRFGIKVWDPDGWRSDGKPWDEPISEDEFERRAAVSTVGPSVHPEGGTQ